MEKAYDIKVLGERLKDAGLIEVEDGAIATYQVVKQWIKDSALLSTMPYDDLAVPFLDQIDALVLPKLDQIDGIEGN